MIKAVIFDLDGVIFNSEDIHTEAEKEALNKVGIPVTKEDIKEYSGVQIRKEFSDITHRYHSDISFEELIKIRDEILKDKLKNGFPLVPHVVEVLGALSNSFRLAVASSGERRIQGEQLKKANLMKYFKAIILGEDITNPKPNPEPYIKAAKKLGVVPSECVGIEDSISGFKAVKEAGMTLIAIKAEHNTAIDFSLADYIIEDLREIPTILGELR